MAKELKVEGGLNATVAKVREVARDGIRLQMVNKKRDEILSVNKEIAKFDDQIEAKKKSVLVAEYEISKLDAEHPKYEEIKLSHEDGIAQRKATLEDLGKRRMELNDTVASINEAIAKIESGETKVSAEKLSEETSKLLEYITAEAAKNAVA